eukprot:scaffold2456_cov129-Isochrysis_galbana.AAC.3
MITAAGRANGPMAITHISSSQEEHSDNANLRMRRTPATSADRYRPSSGKPILHEYRGDLYDTQSDDGCDDEEEEDMVYFGCLSPQMVMAVFLIAVSAGIWGVAICYGMVLKPREMFSFDAWVVRCSPHWIWRALMCRKYVRPDASPAPTEAP